MDHIDSKFIGLLSPRLGKFKRVKANLYNFRCPICGDSQKNKSKARGYLYAIKTSINYKCHNCGASMTFNNFLKKVDANLYSQYALEKFKDGKTGKGSDREDPQELLQYAKSSKPKFERKIRIGLPDAYETERGSNYLRGRKVSGSFFYAERFKEFVNSIKSTFDDMRYDEDRIVIPLYHNQKLVGVQGRSIDPNPVKYITVMFDDEAPKIFGLDNVRTDAPVYVTEGPFDSTFIRNAIAMCGADADVSRWGISDPVYVYDNEPRNREIVSRIGRTIDNGDSVVIWPIGIKEKDINDMFLAGHDVQDLVQLNTYSGLEAKLKFNLWKKV